ncbi:MAG: hypothetical protein HKP17_09520 [Ignavibacteriaceae bacterium]|nr:hypothetical protein [Ignavibacteriaceae bacterium]
MGTESKYYKEILSKLEGFIRKEHFQFLLLGIQVFLLVVIANFTFYSLLELIANFNSIVRTVLFILLILLAAALFLYLIVIPILRYFGILRNGTYKSAAQEVGKNYPDINDDLLNSIQLVSEEERKSFYSRSLIDAAFKNLYNRVKELNFSSIVKFERPKKVLPYFIGLIFFCIALFALLPEMTAASNRLINFTKEFVPPPKFILEVNPGNKEIIKGDELSISVKVIGSMPDDIFLSIRNQEEAAFNEQKLTTDSGRIFSYGISNVISSFKYFASAENIKSDLYEITVIDHPIIESLELLIKPPAYSKIPGTVQKDNGNINSLFGTRVEYNLFSNKKLKEAYLEFSDSSVVKLSVKENSSTASFRIKGDTDYKIKIEDINGNNNLAPITYKIKADYDAYPSIELIAPNKNIPLANDNRVNLISKVSDDFGFTKLLLHYRLSASRYEPPQSDFNSIEIQFNKNLTEADVNYIWNLTELTLGVDDVVTYYLEIFDNDNVSGPKSAKTPQFTIRVPSLDEILNDADQIHAQTEEKLEKTLEEAELLKKSLEEIDQELKKDDQKITWEEKEKIENALEKFQKLQDKVDNINDQLSEMKQNLSENNLLSEETLQKYMELQELMDELTSEEMKRAMEQLQNMLKDMNRNLTQNALEDFKIDEEKFQKSIERTLNLLKRIQIEQKVDELVKRTEEFTKQQEDLLEQTKQSNSSDQNKNENLSKQQDELTKDLDRLKQEMENLKEKMNELEDMPLEYLQKMMEEFNKQQNQKLSEDASKNLQQTQQQNAMNKQQQLSQNMNQMSQMMQQMKESMQQQNQMQTFTEMMKILDNLISLSKKQEELKNETEKLDPNSLRLNELAQKQKNLSSNLQNLLKQMGDLSQKTFAITPEMGKSIGEAMQQMEMAIQSMQNRNGSFSAIQQTEAMKSLNESAMMMKNSMESMMQGGSCGGMMSLMQQLQQLSGQQMNLNNLTQMLQKMQQGGLNQQQQMEFQRLAQQQELIGKSMAQLNQEAKLSGQSSKLPGDLDDIVKQMKEVITDMNTEKLDDELIQKQENILSKMLDAQRSINERDFEKERKSRTGETVLRNSPNKLNLSDDRIVSKLRDELNKAVKEGYSRDYEELIRRYYEALQSEQLEN